MDELVLTASEIIRRNEEKDAQIKEFFDALPPLGKMLFLIQMEEYAKRMFYSGGPRRE